MFDPGLMDMIMSLRGRGVFDSDVLRAVELVPRRHFIAAHFRDKAYDFQNLPIDCGQTISDPLHVAMMTMALEVTGTHKVLEIGTGSGYHAGILSRLCTRVYTIERYKSLVEQAEERFETLNLNNIVVQHGDGLYGWKGQAPFDRVMVTCGLKSVPKRLMMQLTDDGVLVASIKGYLTRVRKNGDEWSEEKITALPMPLVQLGKSMVL